MTDAAKGRMGIKVSAVVILVGAAILWWDLTREGFTIRGVFLPAIFTFLGIFWLSAGSRAKGSENPGKADSGSDAE